MTELDAAISKLQQVLDSHSELAKAQNDANKLKEEELKLERDKAENHRRELDLQSQDLALKRETLNRAESRLQEIVQRYVNAENKLITIDDAFGETVQRLIEQLREVQDALRDVEKALLALLTRESTEIHESRQSIKSRREKEKLQDLLLQHTKNLYELEQRAARRGAGNVPVDLINDIEQEKKIIAELDAKLR